ncbi:MAG TPA: translation initiation factor IF-2 [Candidatus Pacearchaeota archaeon]|nr:translation initiation factor IF-2 [Candidatus Pacearchaeota archaeon]
MTAKKIRQPIVTVVGHVDHGKTSILDKFRQSYVQKGEAGGITQKISFTLYPMENLKKACSLIDKRGIRLNIPGFLFIDTPGHAAFTNLRKRGGSLADLAILVIDINDGIKPQTAEVIQILKHNKTPFIIALNKIDNISGWKKQDEDLIKSIETQPTNVKQNFDEKYMTLIGSLHSYGFEADLFHNISDFTKKIALVPCSAKTGEGIPELIMMLCGLSQKYLKNKLTLGKEAKGVILEIKKEKDCYYLESILYDGELSKKDKIVIANLEGNPVLTKIRVLEEIEPLSNRFKPKEKVTAASGLRIQTVEKPDILPGMPFQVYGENLEEIKKSFKKEFSENIKTEKQGIIVKADSLGSLEALLLILKQSKIPVVKAGIGPINKSDVISAKANLKINELDAIIAGFNISIDEEAKEMISEKIKILTDDVIYKLIENLTEFRADKRKEIEKKRMMGLTVLGKVKILPKYVFRNTSPAIFGVRVEAGKLIPGINLTDNKGEKIGRIKNMQLENKSVEEASEGTELAISVPGINFERKLKNVNFLYSDITESQFRNFKKNKDLLSASEISLLEETAEIKRQQKSDWGR